MEGKGSEACLVRISPLTSHDGPGMRTTLFFKGCSLHCRWCHNPETICRHPELAWNRHACIGCGVCERVCENGAVNRSPDKACRIDTERCLRCFSCVEQCPSKALQVMGRKYSIQSALESILKDEALIKAMHGGVTFSGGEPALQPDFICELSKELKCRGIHLALDTCGQAACQGYLRMLPFLDLLLYDLKEIDPDKHSLFTGSDNRNILDNLYAIAESIRREKLPARFWIRTPLVPGMTATSENISGIGKLLDDSFSDLIDKWELCAFNNMCKDKYASMGLNWSLATTSLLTDKELADLLEVAKQSAGNVKMITASGLTTN